MLIADVNTAPWEAAPACPYCLSIDCRSNRIPNLRLDEAAVNAWNHHRRGRTAEALRTLAIWALLSGVNRLRDPWSCDYCREGFQ